MSAVLGSEVGMKETRCADLSMDGHTCDLELFHWKYFNEKNIQGFFDRSVCHIAAGYVVSSVN